MPNQFSNTNKENIDIKEMYGKYTIKTPEHYIEENNIDIKNGLSNEELDKNYSKYGKNIATKSKSKKWYHYFFNSLFNPFNTILLVISLVLFYTDVILSESPNYANIIVIYVLITTSTLLDFFEEFRSNKTAEKLRELVSTNATVIRNSEKQTIPVRDLTIGDIVILSAGDMIPADLKVLESTDLFIRQSTLTGESDAIKKVSISKFNNIDDIDNLSDIDNICFTGTNVISGYAKCVVIKISDDTYFGKISHTLTAGKPETNFQKGIKNISKLLIRFMIFMVPITFIITSFKHNLIESFTFAVAIAITITPLLLPVILSSSLAKGARKMSKKKTIVKKLDSIQNFGSMTILCTDKTGTLTEDKIVLERYLNFNEEEDKNVLKHAFLNAYFQTGIKSNIDEAVIDRGLKENILNDINSYEKFDEIPFDFTRRKLSVAIKLTNTTNNNALNDTSPTNTNLSNTNSSTTSPTESNITNTNILITKGAVEEMLSVSNKLLINNTEVSLTNIHKENILKLVKKLNQEGLRVVALATKNNIDSSKKLTINDERNMTLVGLVCFLDPPKESAKLAIEKLRKYKIKTIVLTGDNVDVTRTVCNKVGINTKRIVTGSEIDRLSDTALIHLTRKTSIFAKLTPIQKARIVRVLKESGNVVGYLGDGINDSPSLIQSDVGISVDSAVDIAKETADIILLEKDLDVLSDGVIEGRKTFANLLKYIKLAISFNFGEATSVLISSFFLPFFPITPIQLLVQSLLYDFGQISIPYDNVDKEQLTKPSKLSIKSLKNFMLFWGPISSSFDLLVFAILWFHFGIREAAIFQSIWFSYGVVSNLIGMHIIRTAKLPFIESRASKPVFITTILLMFIAVIVPFTPLGSFIGLVGLEIKFIVMIFIVSFLYCFVALIAKRIYINIYKEWI